MKELQKLLLPTTLEEIPAEVRARNQVINEFVMTEQEFVKDMVSFAKVSRLFFGVRYSQESNKESSRQHETQSKSNSFCLIKNRRHCSGSFQKIFLRVYFNSD